MITCISQFFKGTYILSGRCVTQQDSKSCTTCNRWTSPSDVGDHFCVGITFAVVHGDLFEAFPPLRRPKDRRKLVASEEFLHKAVRGSIGKAFNKPHDNSPHLRSRLRIEVRPTENDSTRLYKNGDISVVITCS